MVASSPQDRIRSQTCCLPAELPSDSSFAPKPRPFKASPMSCWYEIDRDAGPRRLPIGEVRHLLSHGQSSITLQEPPAANLPIVWIWRSGGTFGSQSSAAANQRQRLPRSMREPMPTLDRGAIGGWMPLWLCPCCGRRARVLVNTLMNWLPEVDHILQPHWPHTWRCLKCARYRYPSCQPTSKTAPLPTPKTEPPPTRPGALFPEWFRLGCAGGASACSWFS